MLIGVTDATTKIAARATSDGRAADDERHAGRDERAEDEQQGERGQRQGDELASLQVALADRLDVAVERWAAGELDLEAWGRRAVARAGSVRASGESSGGRSRKTMS